MGPLYLVLGCLAYGYPREALCVAGVYLALLLLRAVVRSRGYW